MSYTMLFPLSKHPYVFLSHGQIHKTLFCIVFFAATSYLYIPWRKYNLTLQRNRGILTPFSAIEFCSSPSFYLSRYCHNTDWNIQILISHAPGFPATYLQTLFWPATLTLIFCFETSPNPR